jgi:ParB family chromosome partitioning protein
MIERKPPARLKAFVTESLVDSPPTPTANGVAARAALSTFVEDPNNPRTVFDPAKHKALVEDIDERGVIQPIMVVPTDDGKLMIRHGARRYRAAKELGLDTLPYIVQMDQRQLDRFAQVAENEVRENHTPMDLARFVESEVENGMSKQDIAAKLHKTAAAITYLVSLASAPGFILDLYNSGKCTGPETLYHLRNLWEKDAKFVERRCSTQDVITEPFVRSLKASMDPDAADASKAKKKKSKKSAHSKTVAGAYQPTSPQIAERHFVMDGGQVAIISGGMIVRGKDGIDTEIAGDALAEFILSING